MLFSRGLIPFLILIGIISGKNLPAFGQVVPDNTLGSENTRINRDLESSIDRVEGGAIRANNLFHSFQQFNINAGQSVYFANPEAITNIFSRVTGSNPSQINGKLGVLGNANLFFLNPNGIQFGSEAKLDVRGAFIATTGSSFLFPNGAKFGIIEPQNAPILSVNVTAPVGIEFGSHSGGEILIQGSQLNLDPEQNLSLIGGDIQQKGGGLTVPNGNINLISLGEEGVIDIKENLAFKLRRNTAKGNINFSNNALVVVAGERGGSIFIESGELRLSEQSLLQGGMIPEGANQEEKAGNITIKNTENVIVSDSQISNTVESGGKGNSGDTIIETNTLSVQNGGMIVNSTFGEGNAGNIQIDATEKVELIGEIGAGFPSIISQVEPGGKGNSGNINLNTDVLFIQGRGAIDNSIIGEGNAGNIEITADEKVELIGTGNNVFFLGIGSAVFPRGKGNGGDIEIITDVLSLRDGARISSATNGEGNGGSINITATERVELIGDGNDSPSIVDSSIFPEGKGNGGDIKITTAVFSLQDGGIIDSSIVGKGNAGNINITATERVEFIGEGSRGLVNQIINFVTPVGKGNAGEIKIETDILSVQDGGAIVSNTFGEGNAGSVNILATEKVVLSGQDSLGRGSRIFSDVRGNNPNNSDFISPPDNPEDLNDNFFGVGKGNAGLINIETNVLSVSDGGVIGSSTVGEGKGGEITILATEKMELTNQARVETFTTTGFDAGNIAIETNDLVLKAATITASTSGSGEGGDITIRASESIAVIGEGFLALQNGIITPAFNETLTLQNFEPGIVTVSDGVGKAGEINIETANFTVGNGGLLAATTLDRGEGGNIIIEAQNLINLEDSLLATGTFSPDTSQAPSGKITLIADRLIASGSAQALTSTFGASNAGNVIVRVSDAIELFDPTNQGKLLATGLFAATSQQSSGEGGDIDIITGEMTIREEATVTVSAEGTGKAGNIIIEAQNLTLDEGSINATSFNADGGNITLKINDILSLSNESTISATAGLATAVGNGGNLLIDASFLIAEDNSDITANAFAGDGGNITLIAKGIFGLIARKKVTELSDITASSELGEEGVINIETPESDPTSGLTNLPEEEIEVTFQAGCDGRNGETLAFSNLGRSGIAIEPDDLLSSNFVLSQWLNLNDEEMISSHASFSVDYRSFSFVPLCLSDL